MKPRLEAGLPDLFPWRREWPVLTGWPESMFAKVEPYEIKVEEFTDEGTHVVRAELAGLDPDKDIEVEVTGGMLRIRAERRNQRDVEATDYRRTELCYGTFIRMLPLPAGAREAEVKATYRDGILEIRIPLASVGATKVRVNQA